MVELMQAVNVLRGDLASSLMHCSLDRFLYAAPVFQYITFIGRGYGEQYEYICTVEEFNNLVAELSAAEWIK